MLGRFRAKLLLRRNKKRAIIQLRLLFSLIHSLLCVPVYHGGKGARLTTNEFSQKKKEEIKGKSFSSSSVSPSYFFYCYSEAFSVSNPAAAAAE